MSRSTAAGPENRRQPTGLTEDTDVAGARPLSVGPTGTATIAGRIRLDVVSRQMAGAFRSEIPALERLWGSSQTQILEGIERSVQRWARWLETGVPPSDEDFEPLRQWTRARAGEGVRLEDLLRAFGIGGRLGWDLIRRHANKDEAEALLDAASLLMRYVDRICAVVADTYLAEREALVSEEERRARDLLERLISGAVLTASDLDLAEMLGANAESSYALFVAALPGRSPHQHAVLAARLRRGGWPLAVTDGARVLGLADRPLELSDLDEGSEVVLVVADATPRNQLAATRHDVVRLAEYICRVGIRGQIRAEDYLLETLLGRAVGPAARLHASVFGPLTDPDHEGLRRTLRVFVAHNHDRAATSETLHIHRNTLAYRLHRIEDLTGLSLTSARDLARVYLACCVDGDMPAG
jgi:hypothetical protein